MLASLKSEAAGLNVADVYLDSCCFVYLVEGEPGWRSVVERLLRQLSSTTKLMTSQLARLECRTKPMRDGDAALLARYDALFGADRVSVLDVTTSIIDRATRLRASHGFKSPDAVHLATAIDHGRLRVLDWRCSACAVSGYRRHHPEGRRRGVTSSPGSRSHWRSLRLEARPSKAHLLGWACAVGT